MTKERIDESLEAIGDGVKAVRRSLRRASNHAKLAGDLDEEVTADPWLEEPTSAIRLPTSTG